MLHKSVLSKKIDNSTTQIENRKTVDDKDLND